MDSYDLGSLNRAMVSKANALELNLQCLADGAFSSSIVIVTEYPGQREIEMKVPMVGGAGRVLWEALRPHGIMRQHCYTTMVVKRQLVDAPDGKKGISKNELSHWQALLQWELSQLPNAKHVLVLGGIALETLIGHNAIDKWRGSVLHIDGKSYVIANNPALVMHKPSIEPIFRLDITKLDR